MRIGIPAETYAGETRVAATPETVKKLLATGHKVTVQTGAGAGASIPDSEYEAVGATMATGADIYAQSEIVLKVRAPSADELAKLNKGAVLVGLLNPHNADLIASYAKQGIAAFSMEKLPRTSRAQAMDVLSSQANIAGYKAVIVAANLYKRFVPMLMTAAGTVKAARVVVLGVGVAGLQAIATAKRLGAVIEASDVRPAVKEQVESLGAKFIDVPYETDEEREAAQGVGGYAKPMPPSWMERQKAEVAKRVAQADIVITTALIPGRPAPVLVSEDMVKSMKPGSVIVDLAAEAGGNCPLTELNKTVVKHGVTLVGESNLPGTVAADASALYARNLLNFINLLCDPKNGGAININREDDIIAGSLIAIDGAVVTPARGTPVGTPLQSSDPSAAKLGRNEMSGVDPVVLNLTVFVLAIFVGYHVVWNVTPALHTPLMAVTNAVSGIIIVGAMLAAGPQQLDIGTILGLVAVTLAAVNVFGGFLVTQRMLDMFKKKSKSK